MSEDTNEETKLERTEEEWDELWEMSLKRANAYLCSQDEEFGELLRRISPDVDATIQDLIEGGTEFLAVADMDKVTVEEIFLFSAMTQVTVEDIGYSGLISQECGKDIEGNQLGFRIVFDFGDKTYEQRLKEWKLAAEARKDYAYSVN